MFKFVLKNPHNDFQERSDVFIMFSEILDEENQLLCVSNVGKF